VATLEVIKENGSDLFDDSELKEVRYDWHVRDGHLYIRLTGRAGYHYQNNEVRLYAPGAWKELII